MLKRMACETDTACCVRGYHIYKDTWAAAIGEVLVRSREPINAENLHKVFFLCTKNFLQRNKANCTHMVFKHILTPLMLLLMHMHIQQNMTITITCSKNFLKDNCMKRHYFQEATTSL